MFLEVAAAGNVAQEQTGGTSPRRCGFEVGATIRLPKWGGLFTRVGYLWGEQGGFTWYSGLQLGTSGTVALTLTTLIITAIIFSAMDKAGAELANMMGGG